MGSKRWMPIEGFEERYELSETGDIRSLATGKLLTPRVIGNNLSVTLFNGEKYIGKTIAKLLSSHFNIRAEISTDVQDLPGEDWREIPGFEGLYWISSKSRIKSRNQGIRNQERILKPIHNKRGFLAVYLHKNNRKHSFSLHRLLGKVFLPNPQNKPQVIHINGNRKDNRLENLCWATNSESQKNAVGLGLKQAVIGEDNVGSVAVVQLSLESGREIKRWGCVTDVERELGIWHSNIAKVCRGKRKSAGGYGWCYEEDWEL